MEKQINNCIAELLYEHDEVIIPGLGAFSLAYKPSNIDPVQGKIQPPAKSISFNEQVAADDGLFVRHLSEKTGQSEDEARQAIRDYVEKQKAKLQQKDIVIIDQVGRLYVDFENTLQFLPDTTNFNTDTFGLPAVQAIPVQKAEIEKPAPLTDYSQATPDSGAGAFLRRNLGLIIGIAIVVVVAILFAILYPRFFQPAEPDPTANLPETRTNVPPPPSGDSTLAEDAPALDFPTQDNTEDQFPADEDNPAVTEEDDYDDSDTEASTPPPNQKSAVIAIGVFRDANNVNKLVERIYAAGYEPYLNERNGSTRVGIQLSYQNQSEVQSALRLARREFADDAFIMRRE